MKNGLRLYSIEYFVPELRNELAGYLDPDEIDKSLVLLTSLHRPRLSFADLERTASELASRRSTCARWFARCSMQAASAW